MFDFCNRHRRVVEGNHAGERGATAVEYGLMVALIAVVITVAVTAIGTNLSNMYTYIAGLV